MVKVNFEASNRASFGDGLGRVSREEICLSLIQELQLVRQSMLEREAAMQAELARTAPHYRESARNLIHYLALRMHDIRPLQEQLAWLGLSSLGRSGSHALDSVDKVLGILHCLTGLEWADKSHDEPGAGPNSRRLLETHAVDLLGECPPARAVRIMVTLPATAATDYGVVRELMDAGMDIARINCEYDDPDTWRALALNVRRAAASAQRNVRILMDLCGPKIRTGEVAPRPPVLRVRPQRDDFGRPYRPYRLGLKPNAQTEGPPDVDACVGVDERWLMHLKVGSQIDFSDARGAKRHLLVVQRDALGAVGESVQTAYVTPQTLLSINGADGKKWRSTLAGRIETLPGVLHLRRGDLLRLTRDGLGQVATMAEGSEDEVLEPAHIACSWPEVIDQVQVGERIWFDDGRIGGVIRRIAADGLWVEITQARDGGEKLIGNKSIHLPDSALDLPALTERDLQDLAAFAESADMVALSFVQQPHDVTRLREHLQLLGRPDMGIVLKVETLKGFENLPELMLAAMSGQVAGVMVARGDLAVECGYERLAEVQDEILWCAEAAHLPVIWAAQVLETLTKTGVPTRSEISDAGQGARAECVMLNKGAYITEAIRTLDDVLKRRVGHQTQHRSLLRTLHAWGGVGKASAR